MPVLISGVYILHLLPSNESLVSSDKSIGKVSRWLLRVKRMVSAQPSSHSNSILLPLLWAGVRNIPLCKGGSLPVCPCRTQIWVTGLLSSVCLTNPGREKCFSCSFCALGVFDTAGWRVAMHELSPCFPPLSRVNSDLSAGVGSTCLCCNT